MAEPRTETHSAHISRHIKTKAGYMACPGNSLVRDLPVAHFTISREVDGLARIGSHWSLPRHMAVFRMVRKLELS